MIRNSYYVVSPFLGINSWNMENNTGLRQSKDGCYPNHNPRGATLQIMDVGPHVPWTKNANGLWPSHHYMVIKPWDVVFQRWDGLFPHCYNVKLWLWFMFIPKIIGIPSGYSTQPWKTPHLYIDDFPCENALMASYLAISYYFCGPIPHSSWFYISGLREDLRLKPLLFYM